MIASAERIARGTVRAGLRISPPGVTAISMPMNANTSTRDPLAIMLAEGTPDHARLAGSIAKTPTTMSRSSGASLSTVSPSTRYAPVFTPRMFAIASPPNSATSRPLCTRRARERGKELADRVHEHVRDAGAPQHEAPEPHDDAHQVPHERAERRLCVDVGAAGARGAASCLREAERNEGHGDRADDVCDDGRRPEDARDGRGRREDRRADHEIDRVEGQFFATPPTIGTGAL